MALTDKQIKEASQPVVWIGRRDGAVYGFWRNPPDPKQDPGAVAVYESDPEVQAFLTRELPKPTALQKLAATGLTVADLKGFLAGK